MKQFFSTRRSEQFYHETSTVPLGEVFEAEPELIVVSVQFGVTGDFWQENLSHLQRTLRLKTNIWSVTYRTAFVTFGIQDYISCQTKLASWNFTWLTVVPTDPCRTICSILASDGSWWVAKASSWVFFCMSSIATSMGVEITWAETVHNKIWTSYCLTLPPRFHMSHVFMLTVKKRDKDSVSEIYLINLHLPPLCGWCWSVSWCTGRRGRWWGWSCVCTVRADRRAPARPGWKACSTQSAAGCSSCRSRWCGPSSRTCRSTAPHMWSGWRPAGGKMVWAIKNPSKINFIFFVVGLTTCFICCSFEISISSHTGRHRPCLDPTCTCPAGWSL